MKTLGRYKNIGSKLATLALVAASITGCASNMEHSMMSSGSLATTLQSSDRVDADKARDAGRKPADVLDFMGIGDGMSVIDIIAASGYYSEVLSLAVGPNGKVYIQNPEFILKMRDGANDKALATRLANNRLPNVMRLDKPLIDTGIEPGSLDAAFTALNLHDVYNRSPQAALDMLITVKGLLKSGGILGVVEHNGNADQDNAKLHRMLMSEAIAVAIEAGFTVEASSVLINPDDDRTMMVFAPEIRGMTDRFVLKLVKP